MKDNYTHKFDWDSEKKELIEVREGQGLINHKNEKVDGKFINKTIYPHHEAINLIVELERQIADREVTINNQKEQFEKLSKEGDVIVDKQFFEKFKAAMARMKLVPMEETIKNTEEQLSSLKTQLENIKKVMNSK